MMTAKEVVAANIRARKAWNRLSQEDLMRLMGWSKRTVQNKLSGVTAVTSEELARLAVVFGLNDPGLFFRVPDGFVSEEFLSAWIAMPLVSGYPLAA